MCTAVTFQNRYFGRNLDYDYSFGEEMVLTSQDHLFVFPEGKVMRKHHAILGVALVQEGYPLYFDAMNEKGLAMAGLLFEGNAVYHPSVSGKDNIPSWAFIPWVLGQCETVTEAEKLLENLNLTDTPFSENLPPSPLHWMIADRVRSIVVESMADGIHVYENPVGVLTNNPPFPFHLENLNQYLNLTAEEPNNRFSEAISLQPFSRGMGAMGLPGDWSSPSRFIRGVFVGMNAVGDEGVSQFFHILSAVEQPKGCVRLENGGMEHTLYSVCYDLKEGICYQRGYHVPDLWKKADFSMVSVEKLKGYHGFDCIKVV